MTSPLSRPRRPRRGYRLLAGGTSALVALVTYIVVASGAAHEREDAALGAAPPAVPSVVPSAAPLPSAPAAPPVVRTPLLGVSTPTLADLDRFITATGTTPEVFDVFEPWSRGRPLDRVVADAVAARGIRLSITWEPWDVDADERRQPAYSLASITAGRHDDYIDRFARSIAEYGHPVTIRLMHEMNGNWYPWGSGVNGNRTEDFVPAWRHVHDRFTALGVTDVQWLWAPNALYPGAQELAPLYPGDDYVDAVGVSNYNWGDERRDGYATVWTTFEELFDESFAALRALTSRPLWVTETGSSDRGGDKADWLAAMLTSVSARPDVAGVIWFSHVDEARDVDWRIETEPEVADVWRQGFLARPVLEAVPD